jgi:hypothetical protein
VKEETSKFDPETRDTRHETRQEKGDSKPQKGRDSEWTYLVQMIIIRPQNTKQCFFEKYFSIHIASLLSTFTASGVSEGEIEQMSLQLHDMAFLLRH